MNWLLKVKINEKFGTQADFASVAGIDEPTVSRVIRRRKPLDPDEQRRWANLLGCEVREVFSLQNVNFNSEETG